MKTSILTILAYFIMCGVSYASDVYITQSGATLTANINQDGQTNRFGDSTTAVTLTGDTQTLDIDQIGNTNTIATSLIGAIQEFTLRQAVTAIHLLYRLVQIQRQVTTALLKRLQVVQIQLLLT